MQNSGSPFSSFPSSAQELMATAKLLLPPKDAASAEKAEAQVREAIQLTEAAAATSMDISADLGSAYLFLGQILELQGKPENLEASGRAYDRARDLLVALPNPDAPLRRLTALAWMNRGNVRQKLAKPDDIAAYDQALGLLSDLDPADTDGLSVIAAVYLNRGSGLLRQNNLEGRKAAAASFELAIQSLEKLGPDAGPQFAPLLAAARVNYAGALLGLPGSDFKTIRSSAIAGLQLVGRAEAAEYGAADLGLRARRILCESIGLLLGNPNVPTVARNELISEGTDLAESALTLTALWEQRNLSAFRPMIGWFFSFASALYARQQPQFLSEFLSDTLSTEATPLAWKTSPQLARIAFEAVELARSGVEERLKKPGVADEADKLTDLLTELASAGQKYQELAKSA